MPRGTTLANVLLMVKAELGYNLTANVATADDQQLYHLIDDEQKRLAAQYDWSFLEKYVDVVATANTRNLTFPTALVTERPLIVWRKFVNIWEPLEHGIEETDYNAFDSDRNIFADPIKKWQLGSDGTTFEVWPVPATAQTVRFHGQRPLTSLLTSGAYDPTKTLDLDDLLVALYVAAGRLSRTKQADAPLVLQKAENRLQMLRASGPQVRQHAIRMGGDFQEEKLRRTVGMTVIAAP